MKNIIDYAESEFRSMKDIPLNVVDSLILSQFSYIHFDKIVPSFTSEIKTIKIAECFVSEHFETMFTNVRDPQKNRRLLGALASNPRFRDIEMTFFVNDFDPLIEKQFAAVTFILPDKSIYIAFRGTDNTIVGWKEDFKMAFVFPVPSQVEAKKYLSEVSQRLTGKIFIGGHSKGGNLAVYSAFTAPPSIQDRIIKIFDHDGPGFKEGALDCDGYRQIESKIYKTIPQSSIIGMLLYGHEKYTVVESSRIGVMQHDPFSWKIENGNFIIKEEVSNGAKYVNRTIKDWLNSLSDEKLEVFIDLLFKVLDSGDASTISEITSKWRSNFFAIFSRVIGIDPQMKRFIRELIREFGVLMIHNLRQGRNY